MSGAPAAQVAGLLLTGGSSRRLGRDKAELVVGGERLADRAARVLGAACGDLVVEVGPGYSALPSVREQPLGSGPLAALAAGAAELGRLGHDGPVILLAVDLPFVEPPLLVLLASYPGGGVVVPVAGGRRQQCCARYGSDTIDLAARLVRDGERSLTALLDAGDVRDVPEAEWRTVAPERALADLDTPADLERFGLEDGR